MSNAITSVSLDAHTITPRVWLHSCKKEHPSSRVAEVMSPPGFEVRHIGVIGAGTMGAGIAASCVAGGFDVTLIDTQLPALENGLQRVRVVLDAAVKKGRLAAEVGAAAKTRIAPASDIAAAGAADLVIEAVFENLQLKQDVFRKLDASCRAGALLATNTSTLDVDAIANVTQRPENVIGMHFFNPVPMMKLVEVVRGLATSNEAFATVKALAEKLEKTPVEVNDAPGFVSNRVLMPLLNEAMYVVMEGVATPEAVDEVFKLGMAHPMGPLTLADFIGLDICLDIMRVLHGGLGDPKYRPCPLLIKMVDAGWLGKKSGRGFYNY